MSEPRLLEQLIYKDRSSIKLCKYWIHSAVIPPSQVLKLRACRLKALFLFLALLVPSKIVLPAPNGYLVFNIFNPASHIWLGSKAEASGLSGCQSYMQNRASCSFRKHCFSGVRVLRTGKVI